MNASTRASITVRRPVFEFPADLDPVIVEGHPEESFAHVGLSLLLPYLEPYLIRTMQAAKPHVSSPDLLRDLAAFNAQEGQHYRQHMRFNEHVRMKGFEALAELEAELERDYRRFTDTRSLRWNLAYAEGFEALTMSMARFGFEQRLFDRMHPSARDLFRWHLVEEIEHRCVAFDVYQHVARGYFYRLAVGLFAQWHLNRFVLRAARAMELADPVAHRAKYGGWGAKWARVKPLLWLALFGLLPKVLRTYLPWYSPHAIAMPAEAQAVADEYVTPRDRSHAPVEAEA